MRQIGNEQKNNAVFLRFKDVAATGGKALICYVVGGYPTLDDSKDIIATLIQSGADIIEIGIPFSDPMADGPIIQKASLKALKMGITPRDCFELASHTKKQFFNTPLLSMTYSNIVFANNFTKFLKTAKKNSIDGFIIPDLNIEESNEYLKTCSELGLATVFLTAPNTNNERLGKISAASTGFVYMVSVFGITGSRTSFEKYTYEAISRTKSITKKNNIPLAVGFGISNSSDGKKILDAGADGIIIGSSILKIIMENEGNKQKMLNDLGTFIRDLKKACTTSG
ncbi:MAG: tryptophan synthase subunit alpha [Thermoproteota archaeon]|nr:tryptophan synthase subunit alpha [Thermoproteota archaeon]